MARIEIGREAGSPESLLSAVQNALKAKKYLALFVCGIPHKDDSANGVIEAISAVGGGEGINGRIVLNCVSDVVEHCAELLSISQEDMLGLIAEDLGLTREG